MNGFVEIVCTLCFFITLVLIIFRICLQIHAGIILKKYPDFCQKIGIDKLLFFIPEFSPIKTYKKIILNEDNKEITKYYKNLKLYKYIFIVCIILWVILIFYGIITTHNKGYVDARTEAQG